MARGPLKWSSSRGEHHVYFIILLQLNHYIDRLNINSNMWALQVKHFSGLPQYSVLVFDNRGVGNSDTPKGPYSFVLSAAAPLD